MRIDRALDSDRSVVTKPPSTLENIPSFFHAVCVVALFYSVFLGTLVLLPKTGVPSIFIAQLLGWSAAVGAAAFFPFRSFRSVFSRGEATAVWIAPIVLAGIGGTGVLFSLSFLVFPLPEGRSSVSFPTFRFLSLVALAPVAEELFFREWMLRGFLRRYSTRKAILLNAFAFSVFHIAPVQILPSFFAGIFFAWLYLRTRSVWAPMLAHCAGNIFSYFPHVFGDGWTGWWLDLGVMSIFLFAGGIWLVVLSRPLGKYLA